MVFYRVLLFIGLLLIALGLIKLVLGTAEARPDIPTTGNEPATQRNERLIARESFRDREQGVGPHGFQHDLLDLVIQGSPPQG